LTHCLGVYHKRGVQVPTSRREYSSPATRGKGGRATNTLAIGRVAAGAAVVAPTHGASNDADAHIPATTSRPEELWLGAASGRGGGCWAFSSPCPSLVVSAQYSASRGRRRTRAPINTGSRSGCTSPAGASDMVGNLWEWVADWVPESNTCPGWDIVSDDYMCLSGASTVAPHPQHIRDCGRLDRRFLTPAPAGEGGAS